MQLLTDAVFTILSWCLGILVPKDPRLLVVGGRQFGGNTRPVFEAAASRGFRAVWLTRRPEILSIGHRDIVSTRSLRGAWLASRAGAVLLTHSLSDFGPLLFPGERTFLFNLWHGMPIKRISTADPGFMQRKHARSNLREMKRYGAMLATSPKMAELFSRTFGLPSARVLVVGQPRTDVILGVAPARLDELFDPPLPPHRYKVLYCPTWREGEAVRLFPFSDRDDAALQTALEGLEAVVFVRTHPNDAGKLERRTGRLVPLQGDIVPEITDALSAFDVLVTDYSSVYYDFLLLDRPTVFVPYDLERYEKSPGFYLPFEEIAAGSSVSSQRGLINELRNACVSPKADAAARARVRDLVHTHCDARATARVFDQLLARS